MLDPGCGHNGESPASSDQSESEVGVFPIEEEARIEWELTVEGFAAHQ